MLKISHIMHVHGVHMDFIQTTMLWMNCGPTIIISAISCIIDTILLCSLLPIIIIIMLVWLVCAFTGHSDVVMGVICTNSEELNKKLKYLQNGEPKFTQRELMLTTCTLSYYTCTVFNNGEKLNFVDILLLSVACMLHWPMNLSTQHDCKIGAAILCPPFFSLSLSPSPLSGQVRIYVWF